jgi:hypothetical protein
MTQLRPDTWQSQWREHPSVNTDSLAQQAGAPAAGHISHENGNYSALSSDAT